MKNHLVSAVLLSSSIFLLAVPVLAQEEQHDEHHPQSSEQHQHHLVKEHSHHNAAFTSPVGLMGTHLHSQGEWMVSAGMMINGMSGLLDQSSPVTASQALDKYEMVPDSMLMGMPMLGLMYAPTDWMTLMAMVPGMGMQMSHVGHEAHMHTMQATASGNMQIFGFGDISLSALLGKWHYESHCLHLHLGMSLPTGAIDVSLPSASAGAAQLQPYMMRMGSGTLDFLPALTYTGNQDVWSWGLQPAAVVRLGKNSLNYHLGHRLNSSAWLSYRWLDQLSSSVRLQAYLWGNVEGSDTRLDVNMSPSSDANRTARQGMDLLIGLNWAPWQGQRLGLEVGLPLYQNVAGPQLAQRWLGQAGWQMSF